MEIYRHFEKQPHPCVMTIGNYDGIHTGHQSLLDQVIKFAKKENFQSAVMTFEPHPKEFFNVKEAPKRIISLREKLELFEEKGIDRAHIIRFDALFSQIKSDAFFCIFMSCLSSIFI